MYPSVAITRLLKLWKGCRKTDPLHGPGLLCKLAIIKRRIFSVFPHQLFMVSHLFYISVLHVQNHVSIPDGGKAMGNHKTGTPLHQLRHSPLNQYLRMGIHITGGLVQNHDFRIGGNGPGNGKKLPLPLRNIFCALCQLPVVSAGKGFNKIMGTGRLCGSNDLFSVHIFFRIPQIIGNGPLKKPCVLQEPGGKICRNAGGYADGQKKDSFFAYGKQEPEGCDTVRPAGNYLRTFCVGGWDRLQKVYRTVCRFAAENHLELSGYAYEEGLNEMSLQRREDYITMITVGCRTLTATELHSGLAAP